MPRDIKQFNYAIILLVIILAVRGLSLEYTNLVDPTESRYATIAQEMAFSGDWLTPTLPTSGGSTPYLGKPPLHFWLTTISYELFGMEEWAARMPSFLAAIVILFLIYKFSSKYFNSETGIISALIAISSGMFFFLAGASVTDVTLTACISGAVVCLYPTIAGIKTSRRSCYSSALFAALAFLCKGPIAIVLIGLPFLLWSGIRKDFKWVSKLPWLSMSLIFVAIIAPWFYASELKNPGFIKYFIWNENIARYLFKDYGDKYGSGHVHIYGMSWLMLIAAFLPWTVLLFTIACKAGYKKSLEWLNSNPTRLFALCWGLSSAIFLTFIRQLHFMYLLPGIPGLAVLTAAFCASDSNKVRISLAIEKARKPLLYISGVVWLGIIIAGAILTFSKLSLLLGLCTAAIGIMLAYKSERSFKGAGAVSFVSSLIVCTYIQVILGLSPFMNSYRSAEPIIQHLAGVYDGGKRIRNVAVLSRNSYSHYWTARAWKSELPRRVVVKYITESELTSKNFTHLLLKRGKSSEPLAVKHNFDFVTRKGEWGLYRRKAS